LERLEQLVRLELLEQLALEQLAQQEILESKEQLGHLGCWLFLEALHQ
jgi:hypothetical protein